MCYIMPQSYINAVNGKINIILLCFFFDVFSILRFGVTIPNYPEWGYLRDVPPDSDVGEQLF